MLAVVAWDWTGAWLLWRGSCVFVYVNRVAESRECHINIWSCTANHNLTSSLGSPLKLILRLVEQSNTLQDFLLRGLPAGLLNSPVPITSVTFWVRKADIKSRHHKQCTSRSRLLSGMDEAMHAGFVQKYRCLGHFELVPRWHT